jgi:hypothetical protein
MVTIDSEMKPDMNSKLRSAEIKRLIEESRALRERSQNVIDECKKQMTNVEEPMPAPQQTSEFALAAMDDEHQHS